MKRALISRKAAAGAVVAAALGALRLQELKNLQQHQLARFLPLQAHFQLSL